MYKLEDTESHNLKDPHHGDNEIETELEENMNNSTNTRCIIKPYTPSINTSKEIIIQYFCN